LASLPDKANERPAIRQLLRDLIDEQTDPRNTVSVPELYAELIRGLARHVEPADDPRMLAALRSTSAEVRLEAVRAWSAGHRGILPKEVADACNDGDSRIRATAVQAVAIRQHPHAREYLNDALQDSELAVRLAAIAALGQWGDGQSRALLAELLKDHSEGIRAETVSALAHAGAEAAVLSAAGDASWRVRLKVAQALEAYCDRDGAAAARKLLDDPSAEVQRRMVLALAKWPLEQAGPLLLEALGKPAYSTRKTAATQLALRWPPAGEFPVHDLPLRRAKALDELTMRFRQQFAAPDRIAAGDHVIPASAVLQQKADPATLARVEQLLRQQQISQLAQVGPGLVAALEQLALDDKQLLPESVFHEVLPGCDEVFAALDRLASADVAERRRAAEALLTLAAKQPLGRLAMARLSNLALAETDMLVWRSILEAVAGDGSEPALRMAYAAVGHASPEVRRRACEHLAAHPAAANVKFLLPALHDSDQAVVIAAVRALRAVGTLDDTQPVRQLLSADNEELQREAAVALVSLHDAAGNAALERLAYSSDPQSRTATARALGQLADPAFTAILIRMLDDPYVSVSRAALSSLPQVVGRDEGQVGDGPAAGTPEQVRRWKKWFEAKGRTPGP
jgi:HEAT repeat protein